MGKKLKKAKKELERRIRAWEVTVSGKSDVIQALGTQAFRKPGSMKIR